MSAQSACSGIKLATERVLTIALAATSPKMILRVDASRDASPTPTGKTDGATKTLSIAQLILLPTMPTTFATDAVLCRRPGEILQLSAALPDAH